MEKVWKSIKPSNNPSDAIYSQSTGQTQIVFPISAEDVFLKGGSVRLTGSVYYKIYTDAGAETFIGSGDDVVATPANLEKKLYPDWRGGIFSCIQQLNIRSLRSGQEMEGIQNYNQLMSMLQPVLHSEQDYVAAKSSTDIACNDLNGALGLIKTDDNAVREVEESFASRVYSGLLYNSEPIPLSNQWGTGGLELTFRLEVPQQVLSDLNETGGGASNGIGAQFFIRDPELQYEVLKPSPELLLQLRQNPVSRFEYNSISSLESVVNSGDHNAVFNLGNLQQVVSVVGKFVPTAHLNSYSRWGFSSGCPRNSTAAITATAGYENRAEIKRLRFTLGGQLDPYEFSVSKNVSTPNPISNPIYSQLMRNGLDAIREFVTLNHTIPDGRIKADNDINLQQSRISGVAGAPYVNNVSAVKDTYKGGELFLVGANYSPFGDGRPVQNTTFGVELQTNIADAHNSPNTLYLFLLTKNVLEAGGGLVSVSD